MWVLRLIEAFGRLVPIGPDTLTSQLNLVLVLANNLAEAEICNFDFSVVEDDILRFEVVMDYFLF